MLCAPRIGRARYGHRVETAGFPATLGRVEAYGSGRRSQRTWMTSRFCWRRLPSREAGVQVGVRVAPRSDQAPTKVIDP